MSGFHGVSEDTPGWTPDQLRKKAREANRGFESQKAAQEAAAREDRFRRALEKFEKDAAEQAAQGKNEAIGFECTASNDQHKFEDLPAEDRAMFERLRKHYEARGFKTRIHGPYTDGGPSHVYTGFDLVVSW